MFGFASSSYEQDWIVYGDFFVFIAGGLSALSLPITGYLLGRYEDTLWLGWVPGAAMVAMGFLGAESGGALIFFGGLVLLGWAVYFLPLIAFGVWLRRRRVKLLAPAPPSDSIQPETETGETKGVVT